MRTTDTLFEEMAEAVRANDHEQFDTLERELLKRYEGGLAGMPKELYARYLEIDRGWPAIAVRPTATAQSAEKASGSSEGIDQDLGPRMAITAKLPESLLEWLHQRSVESGANRSEILAACLLVIQENPAVEQALLTRLRPQDRQSEPEEAD